MMNTIVKENHSVPTGIETVSAEKLLIHMAHQTKNIDHKLTTIIDHRIAQDLQNYYNKVNHTLSTLIEKRSKSE